jgi:hypothetical protein
MERDSGVHIFRKPGKLGDDQIHEATQEQIGAEAAIKKQQEDAYQQRKMIASQILMDAFNMHPESIILGVYDKGQIHVRVSPFAGMNDQALTKDLINLYVSESLAKSLRAIPSGEPPAPSGHDQPKGQPQDEKPSGAV